MTEKKILAMLIKEKGFCDDMCGKIDIIRDCDVCPLGTYCGHDKHLHRNEKRDINELTYEIAIDMYIDKYGESSLVEELL